MYTDASDEPDLIPGTRPLLVTPSNSPKTHHPLMKPPSSTLIYTCRPFRTTPHFDPVIILTFFDTLISMVVIVSRNCISCPYPIMTPRLTLRSSNDIMSDAPYRVPTSTFKPSTGTSESDSWSTRTTFVRRDNHNNYCSGFNSVPSRNRLDHPIPGWRWLEGCRNRFHAWIEWYI